MRQFECYLQNRMTTATQGASKAAATASEELQLSCRLLTRLAASQPAAALQIAQVQIPGTAALQLPGLVTRAMDVLSQLHQPPSDAIGQPSLSPSVHH